MTKVTFYKRKGVYYGFRETGHSEFADEGFDIVCSALSAMTMLIINTIEVAYASNVEYTIDEGATNIRVRSKAALVEFEEDELKRYAVSGLFLSYFYQLNELLEEYYDFLDVEVKDVDYADA